MRKQIKLYNVMFPIWLLLFLPITWLIVLPANFIIDSIVLLLTLRVLKQNDIKAIYKKTVLKIWLLGFLCDFIGSGILFLGLLPDSRGSFGMWWHRNITSGISMNPFDNILSFIYVCLTVAVSGAMIYLLNLKISFKKLELPSAIKHRMALSLAIFTAPYLFLLPSSLLYQ